MRSLLFLVLRDTAAIIRISPSDVAVLTSSITVLPIHLQTLGVLTLSHPCVLCPPTTRRPALYPHVHTESVVLPWKSHTVSVTVFPTPWVALPLQKKDSLPGENQIMGEHDVVGSYFSI